MSSNILQKDKIVSTEKCWHGLEEIVEEINYKNSGLDWNVEKTPLSILTDKEVPDWQAVYCPEKDEIITLAKDSYAIIQNSQLFEIINDALVGVNYKITCSGSLGNCKKVFVCVSLLDKQDYVINGEKFQNYLGFVSSHDGSLSLEAYDCSTRICCQNRLQWSRKEKGLLNLRVRHTKNHAPKIESMKEQIDKLFEKREEFYQTYEGLCARPMSLDQAEKILIGFIAKDELSTRAKNQVEKVKNLFLGGSGNSGATVADLLNGVTEYYSRYSGKDSASTYASSEFGAGRDKKLDFWQAIEDDELDKLAARGDALLLAAA